MARKARKAIPVAVAPKPRRYKDFFAMKFPGQARTVALMLRKEQRFHSSWTGRGRRRVLREPGSMHRPEGRYAPFVPMSEDRETWQCDTRHCHNVGYGPMLRNVVWRRWFSRHRFLCEPCMVRKLGRPLGPRDLRNCPMNLWHPAFDLNLKVSL